MAIATEKTLKKQLTTSNMFNDRIITIKFNELSTQEIVELRINSKDSQAYELLEIIDALTDLKRILTKFSPNMEFQFKASFGLSKLILQFDVKKEKRTSSYRLT
ncbi:TPA: hypothetical protein H1547_002824 [Listeria monocytogenes]|nr:hypothetical protein [Listeria monocytogenes]